jgi:frataxin-like iron-binding protein CyaY
VWAASDVQQQMFNLDKNDYLKNNAGKNMIATLGSFVEQQIAKEAILDWLDTCTCCSVLL